MGINRASKNNIAPKGPTAPRKKFNESKLNLNNDGFSKINSTNAIDKNHLHPLTDAKRNSSLYSYESNIKKKFDEIVPFLKRISSMQNNESFQQDSINLGKKELKAALTCHSTVFKKLFHF